MDSKCQRVQRNSCHSCYKMSGQLYLLISSYDWGYNPSEQKWRCKKERVREIFPFGERDGQEYVHFSFLFQDKQRCHADRFSGTIWVTVKIQNSMLIYCIWESCLWICLFPVLEVIFNIPARLTSSHNTATKETIKHKTIDNWLTVNLYSSA